MGGMAMGGDAGGAMAPDRIERIADKNYRLQELSYPSAPASNQAETSMEMEMGMSDMSILANQNQVQAGRESKPRSVRDMAVVNKSKRQPRVRGNGAIAWESKMSDMMGESMEMEMVDEMTVAGTDRRFEREVDFGMRPSPTGDRFEPIHDNPFFRVTQAPLSTFSIDVDTAAYSKVRMYLMQHQMLPNPNAVRIEELLNYFDYDYAPPTDEHPFAAAMQVADCPWNSKHRLARIGIQGKVVDQDRPPSNLVFLLDVSGSMNRPNKLPLVIEGMKMLVDQLSENDSVGIVVYAGAAGMVLDSTSGDRKKSIIDSLDRLKAGGSTNGAQGIQLAYNLARDHFITGGTNRVILCTDGDFNVGVTGTDQLVDLAAENAKGNIFLTVLGFGTGNLNDAMMEQISNKGNGNYAFIDSPDEARKVLVDQMQGTLVTIAKDVKIQVEFNPAEVSAYRLIGYENRVMAAEDFADDKKDAGEIGAGHTVTALYELVPADASDDELVDDDAAGGIKLRYQEKLRQRDGAGNGELLTLKLRYKQPTGTKSTLLEFPIKDDGKTFSQADQDFQFAASVASFGMLLRNSPHKGDANFDSVEELATAGAQGDKSGYRHEFVQMVQQAKKLSGQ
ncbi:MAG: VWA domain-containing protein [Pirellulaceae bacterium]|nr:VWA domain-containing protein [Pirellulaceae bacterium]